MVAEQISRAWTRLKASLSGKGDKLPRLDEREALEFHKERDPKENCETSPPDDEAVGLHCAWAVEFYTPAHMDNLAKNLLHFNRTSGIREYRHPTPGYLGQRIAPSSLWGRMDQSWALGAKRRTL